MKTVIRWVCGLMPLAIVLIYWQNTSTADAISFPEPTSWWTAAKGLAEDGTLWPALRSTITTFFVSMVIATILGVTAGVTIGFRPRLERALTPLIDFFRTLPPPVMVPVLSLLLGLTMKASVTIVVISVVWPILLNTITAVHEMPGTRREVARVLNLTRLETLFKVTMPSLLPGVVVGLRTALSIGLVVTLLTDVLGSADGIGRLLVIQQQLFQPSGVWALLFIIGVLGYALNLAVQGGASFLLRRHPASQH